MYILLTGRVDVYRASAAGGTQLVGSILSGDVFGGREYFTDADDCVYTAGIDSVLYVISEESFNDLSWSRPDILFEVLRAAYMPLRKLTASQKTAMTAAESADKPKLAAAAQKAKGKPGAQTAADIGSSSRLTTGISTAAPTEVNIFPDGHKFYPGNEKPEYSKLVFQKDYDCPFCKKSFLDFRVFRSKLFEAAPVRFDLRRYYTDFQTEWYDVITCQYCLFSTLHTYFTEPKPLKKDLIENTLAAVRASIHLDFDAVRDIDFVFATHYLAILCSEGYLSAGKQIRAKLWGNLSWLYEDVDDEEMAKYAAAKAVDAYEAVYAGTQLTPAQEQVTCLSIAGMQYRAGLDRNLKRYLFTAKTLKNGDRTYAKLAEDFMYEIRGEGDET